MPWQVFLSHKRGDAKDFARALVSWEWALGVGSMLYNKMFTHICYAQGFAGVDNPLWPALVAVWQRRHTHACPSFAV
jgi:hypothetical protein